MKKSRLQEMTSASRPKLTSGSTISETTIVNHNVIKTKIENATEGLSSNCFNYLFNRVLPGSRGKENALAICDYVSCVKSEINPSDHYRKNTIILLCNLSIFFKNTKPFNETTREDLLSFMDSYRKTESQTSNTSKDKETTEENEEAQEQKLTNKIF